MRNTIGFIIMIAIVIFSFFPDIKAQGGEKDTVKIKLFVKSDVIQVDPDIAEVQTGTVVLFFTEDPYTFTVTIDNYDHFIAIEFPNNILSFNVSSGRPVALTIDTPPEGHNTKYYLLGMVNPPDPAPASPEAPPRIIIK